MELKEEYYVDLDKVINFTKNIYAHTLYPDKEPETLKEHTKLCQKYFKLLYGEKNIGKILDNIIKTMEWDLSIKAYELLHSLFINVITFHDTGKINPEFQFKIMKNEEFKNQRLREGFGTKHSIYSMIMYLDYFGQEIFISGLDMPEKTILYGILTINSYIIYRHHSYLDSLDSIAEMFKENGMIGDFSETIAEDWNFKSLYKGIFFKKGFSYIYNNRYKKFKKNLEQSQSAQSITMYAYAKLLYSILVTCDYYATNEYKNDFVMDSFGNYKDKEILNSTYESTQLVKSIRKFENDSTQAEGINVLRNEMFLEAERELEKNLNKNIFFLEAPTGSGKSNAAMNCSFKLLKSMDNAGKIVYVYPFNTLVDQNVEALKKCFGTCKEIINKITVVNSITPMKVIKDKIVHLDINTDIDTEINNPDEEKEMVENYERALLDRQFLNYPFMLTTHVSFFRTLFGNDKQSALSFFQLSGGIIVLDEIQSYKNSIWTEIIRFLNVFAKLLNMKIIIMSATLPNLELLTDEKESEIVKLLTNRTKYFESKYFKDRVKISCELLYKDIDEVYEHVVEKSKLKKKILIEFISKKSAYEFYDRLIEDDRIESIVERITGDDNRLDRQRTLDRIKSEASSNIILVATQVVEAGVDIDMDIGYKDISKLDSEEQFLGRINRNSKREGIVYFFNKDDAAYIYRQEQDYRLDKKFTLINDEMQKILLQKSFENYYKPILSKLIEDRNKLTNDEGIEDFFNKSVRLLNFKKTAKRMELISDISWRASVYLSRTIIDENGYELNGDDIWNRYKRLLQTQVDNINMTYAQKQVELFNIRALMNNFIYEINKSALINCNDKIGDLIKIDNGEQYFINGKLAKEKLETEGELFV